MIQSTRNRLNEMNIKIVENNETDERLQDVRQRVSRCVCRYCGHTLSLRKIAYSAYEEARIELFCEQCNRIEYGTEPEIYQIAEYFIDEIGFDHYPNIDASVKKNRMNIAVVCDIISWGFKNTGFLKKDGFSVKPELEAGILGEATYISNSVLEQMKGE